MSILNNSELKKIQKFISSKGYDYNTLFEKLSNFSKLSKEEQKSLKTIYNHENLEAMAEFVEKYLSLFPKLKLPSGKYPRSNKTSLIKNFKWFFKNYSYPLDVVLKATRNYVEQYEQNNYMYMKTSAYFICKTESGAKISELADYCDAVVNNTDEDDNTQNTYFTTKVV